jgi:hypothetical protein
MKKQITENEVMGLLIKGCTSYQARWDKYVLDNYETGEEHLLYIDLADFASHIVNLYQQNQIAEFPVIFDVIELLHTDGDDIVREAATIGLLEDIQNKLISNRIDTGVFEQYLKEQSLKWWSRLNDFWSGKQNI